MTLSSITIGVVATSDDLRVAEEFFELFKVRWERAVPGQKYGVVLSTTGGVQRLDADAFLIYSSQILENDRNAHVGVEQVTGPVDVTWGQWSFPLFGQVARFDTQTNEFGLRSGSKAIDYLDRRGHRAIRRIGYDLFSEVRALLTDGQPSACAMTPTLELHIALLRQLLRASGAGFVEIPPCPDGYDFICCLTHDIDFFGIRRHKFDRTLAGFVARASVGTLVDFIRGRRPIREVVQNWIALASLSFRLLGLARDFWHPFEDYSRAENGRRATFFLVPFRHRPGVAPDGRLDTRRGVPYQVSDIRDELDKVTTRGGELALHGIDAWRDSDAGRAEIRELTSLTGQRSIGVRMHWLYFANGSPRRIEEAGFAYDSTWGYNDAVGYRSGTSQVFRLPGTKGLLELPLSIMDSALFYRDRMNLADDEALDRCQKILANARRFGGTVVVNWHCRSLAPERLWGRFYRELLEAIGHDNRVWFATAEEAVQWFRWRRSIVIADGGRAADVSVTAPPRPSTIPAARIRFHGPVGASGVPFEDVPFDGRQAARVAV